MSVGGYYQEQVRAIADRLASDLEDESMDMQYAAENALHSLDVLTGEPEPRGASYP